mmetsp:Transcript_84270/g.251140  ORF Transcript_84270/g.251140 Transcript_84270/m.251140 type:complete len:205 (-) Transcript_84270:108-722(-)
MSIGFPVPVQSLLAGRHRCGRTRCASSATCAGAGPIQTPKRSACCSRPAGGASRPRRSCAIWRTRTRRSPERTVLQTMLAAAPLRPARLGLRRARCGPWPAREARGWTPSPSPPRSASARARCAGSGQRRSSWRCTSRPSNRTTSRSLPLSRRAGGIGSGPRCSYGRPGPDHALTSPCTTQCSALAIGPGLGRWCSSSLCPAAG